MKPTPRPFRCRSLAWVATAALILGLAGCGGSDNDGDSDASSRTPEESSSASLPDGFPDGVPLPEHDEIRSAGQLSETTWRLMLVVDPDTEDAAENYAARLTDAGFEVSVSGSIVSGNSPTLSVDAVVRPPTITLQVMQRDG